MAWRPLATLASLLARNLSRANEDAMRLKLSLAVMPLDGDPRGLYRRWIVSVFSGLAGIFAAEEDYSDDARYDVYVGGEADPSGRTLRVTAFPRGLPDATATAYLPKIDGDSFYTMLRAFVLSMAPASNPSKEQALATLLPRAAAEAETVVKAEHTQLSAQETARNLMALAKAEAVAAGYGGGPAQLEKSAEYYTKALNACPELAAEIYLPLGLVYQGLGEKKSSPRLLEMAVTSLDSALSGIDARARAEDRAAVHYRMGRIYGKLGLLEGLKEDFDDACKHYNEALRFYGRDSHPAAWAEIMHAMALAHQMRSEITGDEDSLSVAADYARQALAVRNPDSGLPQFAQTAALMGNIVYGIAKRRADLKLLDQAEKAYLDALDAYRKEGKARQVASITANMRQLAQTRGELERRKLLELL